MAKKKQPSEMTYKVRRAGARALGAGLAAAGTYAAAKGFDIPAARDPELLALVTGMSSVMGAGTPDVVFDRHPALNDKQNWNGKKK
jgi:hypothetical protein